MLQQTITITNKKGLHARAATRLVKSASEFQSAISIQFEDKKADCKSVMSILLLAATVGSTIELITDGSDEQAAMEVICQLFANNFGEDD